MKVSKQSIDEAAKRLEGVAQKTPLQHIKRLSEKYGADVYFKREDLQEVRSFKIRGAYNKMSSLTPEEKKRGVVCASAGNHAQGVAYACSALKVHGVIFMPVVTPNQKIDKVKKFGGKYVEVKLEGDTFDDAKDAAQKFCKEKGAVFVHPFDDPYVVSGQGTVAKEIVEQMDGAPDYVFVAIGGGGLISGIGTYLKAVDESVQVVGVESNSQDSMHESLENRKVTTLDAIDTFVDGTAVKTPGELTFELAQKVIDRVVLGEDGEVAKNMVELYQNEGIVTEPAGALCLSGLEVMKEKIKGKKVVCVICGGNNDILRYPEIMERSLVYQGLKHYFIINFAQKPGQLKRFVNDALGPNDDIVRFEYIKKSNKEEGPALVGIELKEKGDYEPLLKRLKETGIHFKKLENGDMMYAYLV